MSPLFLTVRALSSELARRIYLPVVWVGGGVLIALLCVASWLTTQSAWWLFLLIPVGLFTVLFITIASIAGVVIKLLRPSQTRKQHAAVKALVDKLQAMSDVLQTPKLILLFRLAKDTLYPSEKSFIGEVTSTTASLKSDFQNIIASFKK